MRSLKSFVATLGLVLGVAGGCVAPAIAGPTLLVNGSFEAGPALNLNSWNVYGALPGWQGDPSANSGIELRRQNNGTAQDGEYFVELDTYHNSYMTQQVATTAGEHYTLSWYYSPRAGVAEASNPIEVYWNNVLLFTNTGSGVGFTNHQWQMFALDVVGTGGTDTLRFAAAGTSEGYGGSLDNISLNAVPEPASLALVVMALGGLAWTARRGAAASADHRCRGGFPLPASPLSLRGRVPPTFPPGARHRAASPRRSCRLATGRTGQAYFASSMEAIPLELTLRPPHADDYVALAGWVPDAAAALRWAGPLVRWPFSAELLPQLLAAPQAQSRVLAIADDDTPLGFGQFWPRDDGAVHLGRLITAPGMRRQGHGQTLLQRMIVEATAVTGASRVTLRVYRDNAAAMSLYQRLGFEAMPELSDDQVLFMQRLPDLKETP